MTDAKDNARAWMETIQEAVDGLAMLNSGVDDEIVVTVDGETFTDADTLRQRVDEMPLAVSVRSDWGSPCDRLEPSEYRILLTTGGPALQVFGMLNSYGEPETARLQYQDWRTPWTDYQCETNDLDDPVLTFARNFYFGE